MDTNSVELFDLSRDNIGNFIDMKSDIEYFALYGKDGSAQGGIRTFWNTYIGPRVLASAVCMNKIITKRILKSAISMLQNIRSIV